MRANCNRIAFSKFLVEDRASFRKCCQNKRFKLYSLRSNAREGKTCCHVLRISYNSISSLFIEKWKISFDYKSIIRSQAFHFYSFRFKNMTEFFVLFSRELENCLFFFEFFFSKYHKCNMYRNINEQTYERMNK